MKRQLNYSDAYKKSQLSVSKEDVRIAVNQFEQHQSCVEESNNNDSIETMKKSQSQYDLLSYKSLNNWQYQQQSDKGQDDNYSHTRCQPVKRPKTPTKQTGTSSVPHQLTSIQSPLSSPKSKKRMPAVDRFIAERNQTVDLATALLLKGGSLTSPSKRRSKVNGDKGSTDAGDTDMQKEEANRLYQSALHTELFGAQSADCYLNDGTRNSQFADTAQSSSSHNSQMQTQNSMATNQTGTDQLQRGSGSATSQARILQFKSPSSALKQIRNQQQQSQEHVFQGALSSLKSPVKARRRLDFSSVMQSPQQLSRLTSSPLSPETLNRLQKSIKSQRAVKVQIPKLPYKVLDAPDLADDFYLNLLDWGSQNILAVGLGTCVYLWNAESCNVAKLCDLSAYDNVTSVNWAPDGRTLALGTNRGSVQIWDTVQLKKLRTLSGHSSRVGTCAWNGSTISTGSRDRSILQRDTRIADQSASFEVKMVGHKQEVCGLKWSPDGQSLASGGNDNKLLIWDARFLQQDSGRRPIDGNTELQPRLKFAEHNAAVKAIAWSPHCAGLLASGGGTADRRIRFWNTATGQHMQCIDTGSQVCNLGWSKFSNELVSTHGYSQNQIVVWKCPSMTLLATLTGHSYRVLYLSSSPDGSNIVTGAGDETLRFWNVFNNRKSRSSTGTILDGNTQSHRQMF
ncbi:hypothetical protein MP228_000673 [Amoeboaphelidium protococcarum]|nr:hypothetical protein MP228_000673 [Amoeboaphelidium protococcarum]